MIYKYWAIPSWQIYYVFLTTQICTKGKKIANVLSSYTIYWKNGVSSKHFFIPFCQTCIFGLSLPHVDVSNLSPIKSPHLDRLRVIWVQVSVVFIPNFVKLAFLCLSLPHVDVSNLFYIKSPRLDRLRVIWVSSKYYFHSFLSNLQLFVFSSQMLMYPIYLLSNPHPLTN